MSDFDVDGEKARPVLDLPLMSLREVVMFPRSIVPLFVGREASIRAIENAISDYGKKIFLVAQREPEVEKPCLRSAPSARYCSCCACPTAPSRCCSRGCTAPAGKGWAKRARATFPAPPSCPCANPTP